MLRYTILGCQHASHALTSTCMLHSDELKQLITAAHAVLLIVWLTLATRGRFILFMASNSLDFFA
jgi:hypothetical protein